MGSFDRAGIELTGVSGAGRGQKMGTIAAYKNHNYYDSSKRPPLRAQESPSSHRRPHLLRRLPLFCPAGPP
jgi:hypothetical protein